MKNIIHTSVKSILLFSIFFSLFSTFGQAPQKMSYQAVIRNSSGALIASTSIRIKVSILENAASGFAVYSEDHLVATNSNGLATFNIGDGTVLSGSFSAIDWANGNYFVKTETDPTAGTNYTIVGTSQLTSVPYALSSLDNKWESNSFGINYNSGSVNIGTAVPFNGSAGLTLKKNINGYLGTYVDAGANGFPYYGYALNGVAKAFTQFNSYTNNLELVTDGFSRVAVNTNGNVGIGTVTPTTKLEVDGFTKLGTDAPAIKMGQILATTASSQGGETYVSNPFTYSNLVSLTAIIDMGTGTSIPPFFNSYAGYEYQIFQGNGVIRIINKTANSSEILSKPIKILVTYQE